MMVPFRKVCRLFFLHMYLVMESLKISFKMVVSFKDSSTKQLLISIETKQKPIISHTCMRIHMYASIYTHACMHSCMCTFPTTN